jgi:predicted nucleic acid-binding protein
MISPSEITKSRIVVDTDVFSYFFKNDTRADFFRPFLVHRTLALSFATVAELHFGACHDNWGVAKRAELENAMKNYVILPYSYAVCQEWGRVMDEHRRRGHDMGHADCWIAATALAYDCALATNNGRDFDGTLGLELIAPGLI